MASLFITESPVVPVKLASLNTLDKPYSFDCIVSTARALRARIDPNREEKVVKYFIYIYILKIATPSKYHYAASHPLTPQQSDA